MVMDIRGDKISKTKFFKQLNELAEKDNLRDEIVDLLMMLRSVTGSNRFQLKELRLIKSEVARLFKKCNDLDFLISETSDFLRACDNLIEQEVVCYSLSSLGEIIDPLEDTVHQLTYLVSKYCSKGYRDKLLEFISNNYVNKGFIINFEFYIELGGKITDLVEKIINPQKRSIHYVKSELLDLLNVEIEHEKLTELINSIGTYWINEETLLLSELLCYLITINTSNRKKIQNSFLNSLELSLPLLDDLSIAIFIYLIINYYKTKRKTLLELFERIIVRNIAHIRLLVEVILVSLVKYRLISLPYYSYAWDNIVNMLRLEISESTKFFSLVENQELKELGNIIFIRIVKNLIDEGLTSKFFLENYKIILDMGRDINLLTELGSKFLTDIDISEISQMRTFLSFVYELYSNASSVNERKHIDKLVENLMNSLNPVLISKFLYDQQILDMFIKIMKNAPTHIKLSYNQLISKAIKLEMLPKELIEDIEKLVVG